MSWVLVASLLNLAVSVGVVRAARRLGLGTGRGVVCSAALLGGLTLDVLGAHGAVAVTPPDVLPPP